MDLGNYVDVPTRLRLALERYPELRVQEQPCQLLDWPNGQVLLCTIQVWRTPDDPLPVIASATEYYPGRTSFTKGSETMNGFTSALGRALGYLGLGIQHSIASANEVQAAQQRQQTDPEPQPPKPTSSEPSTVPSAAQMGKLRAMGYGGPAPETKQAASRLIEAIQRGNNAAGD
jgi:hypothetical protein